MWETLVSDIERASATAERAVNMYGELLERFPSHLLPESMLPLPKEGMKAAIKLAWYSANEAQREILRGGYVMLAIFRSDVKAVMSQYEDMALFEKSIEESEALLREIRAFAAISRPQKDQP